MTIIENFFTKEIKYGRFSVLKLPYRDTLERYLGRGQDITQLIEDRLSIQKLQPIEKIASLIIDDMAIKEKMSYSRSDDKFYGLDTINENGQIIGKKTTLANKKLCYVIHGMTIKYTIPAGYFFHRQLPQDDYFNLTMKILKLTWIYCN